MWTLTHSKNDLHKRINCNNKDLWRTENAFFVPTKWDPAEDESERDKIEQTLKRIGRDIPESSIFLRGSLLTSHYPDARSDIDVVVINGNSTVKDALTRNLSCFGRPLDVRIFQKKHKKTIWDRMLLGCRSLLVSGPAVEFAPVDIKQETYVYLWTHFRIPKRIPLSDRPLVFALKKLIRAVGTLRLKTHGQYSRDLRRCILWGFDLHPDIGSELLDLFTAMDQFGALHSKELQDKFSRLQFRLEQHGEDLDLV